MNDSELERLKDFVLSRQDTGLDLLQEPSVHRYLSHVYNETSANVREDEPCGEIFGCSSERHRATLRRKIAQYNMRNGSLAASFVEGDLYQGVVKFLFRDKDHQVTKMLKVMSTDTVESLSPILQEQLRIPPPSHQERVTLYQLAGADEVLLTEEECPLEIAVHSRRNVTFEVRMATRKTSGHQEISLSESAHRKALSNFFGVQENELAIPYSSSLSTKGCSGSNEMDPSTSDEISLYSSSSSSSLTESLNRFKRSPRLFANNSGTGLWLRDKTPTFKRKNVLQVTTSSEKDLTESVQGTPKRKTKTSRITALLENSFSRRKKQNSSENVAREGNRENHEEGLFKLYANFPESDCMCRRVFVDKFSKAADIVRDFLDLSSVSYDSYKDFVLCDVIGLYHCVSNGTPSVSDSKLARRKSVGWREECFRTLDDQEHPLVVQSLWIPAKGRSRRFEIRRKADVDQDKGSINFFNLVSGDYEDLHAIAGIADSIKWSQIIESRSLDDKVEYQIIDKASTEDERSRLYHQSSGEAEIEKEETESSDENAVSNSVVPPRHRPYIICIQGFSVEKDLLFHVLNKETLVIGNHLSARAEATILKAPDIQLYGPDVLLQHCILTCHQVADFSSSDLSFDKFVVSLEPCDGGKISVNGYQLKEEMELRPGDLITIGNYYHFIFRDASSKCQTLFGLRWMSTSSPEAESIYSSFPHLAEESEKYEADVDRWKVAYNIEHEDDVLDFMASLMSGDDQDFGLIPGHLFLMVVEFAAYTQGPEQTRAILLKAANALLHVAGNKAKEMVSTHSKSKSKPSMDALVPDLKILLNALSNALELLNNLQQKLPDYLPIEGISLSSEKQNNGEEGDEDGSAEVCQEILSILEEVVMYSFQQCVYYITKTLYDALPNILSSNPFTDTEDSEPAGVVDIIYIFQKTFDLLEEVSAHSEIVSQLFAYLLFFMNAALFNLLLEKAASGKYLKWSKGVQIRGNLDAVEAWILDKGLENQIHFLQRISSAADLLASPKPQLIQATWSTLRSDYPSLRPSQLHQLLSKYELSNSAKSPQGWKPVGEDIESAKQREAILESFEDHPPLTLPAESSKLDLCTLHDLHSFHQFVEVLRQDLPFAQVYQGASYSGQRRQSKTTDKSQTGEGKVKDSLGDKPLKQFSSHGDSLCDSNEVYQDEKTVTMDCNKNIVNGHTHLKDSKSSPPSEQKVSDVGTLDVRSSSPTNNSKQPNKKSKSRNKGLCTNPKSNSTPKQSDHEDLITPVRSEEEASNLLQEYFSGVSSGHFDSIPEEEDASSGVEDFPLLDDVRISASFNGEMVSASSTGDEGVQSSGIEGSANLKKDNSVYHDTAVENFDPVKYAVGSSEASSLVDGLVEQSTGTGQTTSGLLGKGNKISKRDRRSRRTSLDDVFVVDLVPENNQLGIRFADGMKSSLASPGVYVRGLMQKSAAAACGRLRVGDRILAVDGTSLVGFEYYQAINFIKQPRESYRFLLARSDPGSVIRLTAPVTSI